MTLTGSGGRWARRLAVVGLVIGVLAPAPGTAEAVAADPGDVGWEGPSYQGAAGSPSGSKPQSKVWFNDGLWWATLFDEGTGDFHIFRLDVAARSWVDTGTLVDTRPNSRSDALWTGEHLYVANHVFAESGGSTGSAAQLRRFSYDRGARRYTLDAGFPVVINDVRSETLVIDREPTGRLWATWVQDRTVYVNHTTTDDRTWATPFPLPVAAGEVTSDDISAVVAFANDRIGVMWSNQGHDSMYFAQHLNTAAPGTWMAQEVAYTGTDLADDHINLASVQDLGGRVLAAVKTSRSGSDVLTHLLDRDWSTGRWTSHTFGRASDNHTRPIAVVDAEHQNVHMFATSGQSGGSIYEKTAPLASLEFPTGKGTPVLTDASSPDLNNATSTKQNVSSATGLVVLATNDSTRRYWTHYDPLGGPSPPPGPEAPVASFALAPTSGPAPLDVAFTDTSTGAPTSWSWSFGDGATSTTQHPTHRYTAPGTYDVALTVTNAVGPSTTTLVRAVTVAVAPDPASAFVTAAYTDLLGRVPTSEEHDRHVASIRAGGSRSALARELVVTDDRLAKIVGDLYRDTLGRDPDDAGQAFWVERLRAGEQTVAEVTATFYASAEHFTGLGGGTIPTWVDHLYQHVLGRAPDPGGRDFWVDRASRLGRRSVALSLHESLESRRGRVTDLYLELLGRDPDTEGLAYWADHLRRRGDLALATHLVASSEYLTRAQTRFA
ncbi:DUF4214 domain-containing protein [Iamia sp. SCSIO 61187]|uniref:DUF4214 domain-containing protein n=1 Tax=Iamia sp. SCSIO 61187 TaxID=2722752 RepID=UPI001C6354FC|nr:DUF4214 domain-containing protein [Iamia sp. SCSIO 61187]QYG93466.1 DUF4214 domain-containing protein [Iamia sp. SCSIO 61187]